MFTSKLLVEKTVRAALEEDIGRGDITSEAIVSPDINGEGYIISRADGILAGLLYARQAFKLVDEKIDFNSLVSDGAKIKKNTEIARVTGSARAILTAERVALNFLQRLSGIATATAVAVQAARPWGVQVTDTRKTIPGLRLAEKYAVSVGGGKNHRMGLDDAVLIKDNHLKIAGGVSRAVAQARQRVGHLVKIEVEVEMLEQVREALEAGADVIMLDNMDLDQMRRAVEMVAGRAIVEASGGITPDTVAEVASTGVDVISLGWITHSALPLDISLELEKI